MAAWATPVGWGTGLSGLRYMCWEEAVQFVDDAPEFAVNALLSFQSAACQTLSRLLHV
jgi:hypothetical protein